MSHLRHSAARLVELPVVMYVVQNHVALVVVLVAARGQVVAVLAVLGKFQPPEKAVLLLQPRHVFETVMKVKHFHNLHQRSIRGRVEIPKFFLSSFFFLSLKTLSRVKQDVVAVGLVCFQD